MVLLQFLKILFDIATYLHYNIVNTFQYKVGDYMSHSSQLLKGTLEGCILKIISEKETYGYELYNSLRDYGFENLSEGTLYPLLIRLEKNGLLLSISRDSPYGPKRKYYSLSQHGKFELLNFCAAWNQLSTSVNNVLEGKSNEQNEKTN